MTYIIFEHSVISLYHFITSDLVSTDSWDLVLFSYLSLQGYASIIQQSSWFTLCREVLRTAPRRKKAKSTYGTDNSVS